MQVAEQPDGTIKVTWKDYGTGVLIDRVKKESDVSHPGQTPYFARAARQLALGELDANEYLDAILLHLKAEGDGGARHDLDQPPRREVDPELDLLPMFFTDMLAGAVTARIWTEGFEPLGAQEWITLRGLIGIAWNTANVAEFDRSSAVSGFDLGALSAEAVDILLVACYARRHVDLFNHVLKKAPAPPAQSSFDWFEMALVQSRFEENFLGHHQHSPLGPDSVILEARFWTSLLNVGWVHEPVEWGLRIGLQNLAHRVGSEDWEIPYDLPHLDELHAALATKNLFPGLGAVGDFLAGCPSIARADLYFARFPLDRVAAGEGFYNTHTGHMLVTIIESEKSDDERRFVFVKRLLEGLPGLDLEAPVQRHWAEMRDYGMPARAGDMFTALHAAAWRGNEEIGRLLVEHGAKIGKRDSDSGKHAAAIARARGHDAFAEWAEQLAGSHDE